MIYSDTRHQVPPVFVPLWAPARYKGAWGGRGSGKSMNFAAMAVIRGAEQEGMRGLCVREVQKSLRDSSKLLIEDTINRLNLGEAFIPLQNEIRTTMGGQITFLGMQDHTAEAVMSTEGIDWVWVEQGETLSARSLELLRPTIRKAGSEIWSSWNPRSRSDPIDMLFRGLEPPPDSVVVKASYLDNPFFPPELEAEREYDKRTNPDRYSHIWDGAFEPQAIGAIWTRQVLHEGRLAEIPDVERIVVAVDPAVSDTVTSNEHGIVVCAVDAQNQGYLLEDASTSGSPHKWATRAVAMFDKWEADSLVIEINQGGDMCRHTLQTIRKALPIVEVRATRGKHVRAEPISALYTTGQIHHVGTYPELEDQLCLFTSSGWEGDADKSPDRAEAAIWGFSHLFPALTTVATTEDLTESRAGEGGWMG